MFNYLFKALILPLSIGIFLSVIAVARSEAAQGSGESSGSPPIRLDLGFGQSPPGQHIQIPLTLALPRGTQVGSTTNEITFPSQLLSFQEVREGLSVELAEAEIKTDVKPDQDNLDNLVLTVTIVGREGAAIPRGVLADLMFAISNQAQMGETIVLKNTVSALSSGDFPQPVDSIIGSDGEILIDETPVVFACFFYMH